MDNKNENLNIIRKLNKDEIELRLECIRDKKAVFSFQKKSFVDTKILNEVFPKSWKKNYQIIDGLLVCTVSIYNKELQEWIPYSEIDSVINSNNKKGFKNGFRKCCISIGIGLELFNLPEISINIDESELIKDEKNNKLKLKTIFKIAKISIKDNKITTLKIIDNKKKVRFSYTKYAKKSK